MRNQVIAFLGKLPEQPEDQFNQAVLLYMKSPNVNTSLLRSYNTQGYSEQRLKELLYDLKQAYNVTLADLSKKSKVAKLKPKQGSKKGKALPAGMPKFAKGAKGNAERKAYLKDNNIESDSFKNADMDKAIIAHLKSKVSKIDKDVPKNETNVPETETQASETETPNPDSEKK